MKHRQIIDQTELAALAKKFRDTAGKTRADTAREMNVKQPSIFHAEESPELGYFKLRKRIIETYSPYKVVGPVFLLEKK